MASGFVNGGAFKLAITQKMLQKIKDKGSVLEAQATKMQKEAILFMRAVDMEEMYDKATSIMAVTLNSILLKFQNPTKQSVFVTYGLGGNREYGPRNFIMLAISLFLQSIGSGYGTAISAGQPRRSSTIKEGNIKHAYKVNKKVVKGIARVAKRNKDTR